MIEKLNAREETALIKNINKTNALFSLQVSNLFTVLFQSKHAEGSGKIRDAQTLHHPSVSQILP